MHFVVGLACGCVRVADLSEFPEHLTCQVHFFNSMPDIEISQKIVAIEAREWHTKCCSCRFARWCGADRAAVNNFEYNHRASKGHANFQRTFMIPEDRKQMLREFYPRGVKLFILDGFTGERQKVKAAVTGYQAQLPDEPPF